MVTYTYNISSSGPASNIQSIIDQIVSELASNPTIEQDIEILIDRGTYAGFTIPNGSLFPLFNTAYKLKIKSSGSFFPIIDFNHSNESQYVGVDIGAGNPNVEVDGIRVQYFPVGIRASTNSHFPIVKNCIINNNRNVGILFDQTSEAQAIQNVIINGDYGIVARLVKSASLVHNTIFMNGAISTEPGKSISCIWAELANDYGNGNSDTGVLHLIGNIGWNLSGRCLTLFMSDVETEGRLVSNYNNWVVGDSEDFISIEENSFYRGAESRPRVIYSNLTQWKTTGHDADSRSVDPKFISASKLRAKKNGYAVDLNLLPVSPVLGMVPSFAYSPSEALEWLPTYFDTSNISKDILRNNRSQSGTAAGSNDKLSTSGFFGQDVFSNPIDLDLVKTCGIDPFSNILYKSLDLWYPKLKKGYFYSNEREYYLYSNKHTLTLGESAETTFYLPSAVVHNKPIKIKVSGKEIDSSYYDLIGNKIIIFHKNLNILNGEEEVSIEGSISNWNGSSFNYNKILYRFKINEGETRFYLPSYYVPSGPVVITDDVTYPTDSDYISNREFAIVYNSDINKSEIVFNNNSNKLLNGQFDYGEEGGAPSYWQGSGAIVALPDGLDTTVAGSYVCKVENNGYIRKILPVDVESPHVFSFHTMSHGSGVLDYRLEFYDLNYDKLGVYHTGSIDLSSNWRRYSMSFSSSGQDFETIVPQVPYPCIPLNNYNPPTRSAYVGIELKHIYNPAYTGLMYLDALQYEQKSVPTLYHRKPLYNELTIEFETSNDDYFIDSKLAIAPTRNLVSDGFIFIPEIPASVYDGPLTPAITTLHEWRWPLGRKYVMPWARTKGKDKLRKRPYGRFNLIPEVKPEIISPVGFSPSVKEIDIVPSIPATFVGDTNGVGFSIKVTDSDNNPYPMTNVTAEVFDPRTRYPGLLSVKKYGLKEQLSTVVSTKTDSSGSVCMTWIPPEKDSGLYKGSVPSPSYSNTVGELISVILTEYPVNLDNYGNIIILNNNGDILPIVATTPIKNNYVTTYDNQSSLARLMYPVSPGSVKVVVDGVEFRESQINILESDQFFVDYENSIVYIKGRVTNIYIEYLPSYVYVSDSDPHRIMIYHDKVFGSYANTIIVGYDFNVTLKVTVYDHSTSSNTSQNFELIAQNQLSKLPSIFNTVSLEF